MNADAATPAWFGVFSLGLLCVGLVVASIVLAAVLAARNSARRPRPAAPASQSSPVLRGLGMFVLAALAFLGAAAFATVVYLDLGTGSKARVSGGAYVLAGVGLTVAILCTAGYRSLSRNRTTSSEQVGTGYRALTVAWGVGFCALVVLLFIYTITGSNQTTLGFHRKDWEVFVSLTVMAMVGLGVVTFTRYAWINRRRLAAAISYAHEVPPRPATPILPTAAPVPVSQPTPVVRSGNRILVTVWIFVAVAVVTVGPLALFLVKGGTPDEVSSGSSMLALLGLSVIVLFGVTAVRYLWVNLVRQPGPALGTAPQHLPVAPLVLTPMPLPRVCPKCGATVAAGAAQGLCPRCLLGAMMPLPERLSPTIAHGPFVPPTVEEVAEFFPQFEVLRIVGQGGMGAVYLARQKALDRVVAIKLIRTAHEDDPTFAARFAREARAMAKLSHPNIVAVHDTGEAGGLPFLVMEYVDGVTLRDAIRTKSLTPAQALLIIPQICDALEYAHKQGVVHRDIKPENILLDAAGRVRIADFGLAKLTDPDSMSLTGTMQAMGTPHYMAPEQWEKPGEVDHRADIYALGVVLYELLTGELPLGRFDPPSVKSRVDARIDELVLRALAKEPGRRYQHATDVKLALARIAASPGWVPRQGFFEYKTKTTFLGWPLVHVVSGRDPLTGRGKTAKGWIAVGDQAAVGGIAVGGVTATGGIAISGAMALGGVAVAGGCAGGVIALGGGVAVGALAAGAGGAAAAGWLAGAGGIATGTYALAGGVASGEHVWASNHRDPEFWPTLQNAVSGIWQAIAYNVR